MATDKSIILMDNNEENGLLPSVKPMTNVEFEAHKKRKDVVMIVTNRIKIGK